VCSAEVPMPYAKHLEDAALPQAPRIVDAVRRVLGGRA
jgi:pyruvate dehydrogenase E1 component beta subunit